MKKYEVFIRKSINEALDDASIGCLARMAEDLGIDLYEVMRRKVKKAIKQAQDDKVIEFYKRYSIDC